MPNSIFSSVSVDIPNKSGFDLSHENLFSSKCGTLTPAMIDVLLPGDKVDLSVIANVQLPPFASDFFGKIEMKFEAFFVPMRLLYGGWKEFITIPLDIVGTSRPETNPTFRRRQVSNVTIPKVNVTASATTNPSGGTLKFDDFLGAGSLADFLGYQVDPASIPGSVTTNIDINCLPFICYHKIWDDWYRDSRLTSSCFVKVSADSGSQPQGTLSASMIPSVTVSSNTQANSEDPTKARFTNFAFDGANQSLGGQTAPHLFSLRQRSFAKDSFTACTPLPQAGNAQSVGFTVNTSTGAGSFSIASLRAANSLQMWIERNNLAGNRYPDQIKANYGVYPADGITDRCLYLGRVNIPVYAKSVYQSAPETSGSTSTNNPMASQGVTFGAPQGVKSGDFCRNFEVTEHGYLFVMATLVPTAYYSSGIRPYFHLNRVTDFGWPLLQGVGDDYVPTTQLINDPWNLGASSPLVFGYTQRYSCFKYMNDEVHGLLRDGSSLESFALQRSFSAGSSGSNAPVISTAFTQIPTSFLDQVSAVSSAQSNYGYWCDAYFKYHKISTLAEYSIPTLGDLKNVHKESISLGGRRL